jgi:hypothetical protein
MAQADYLVETLFETPLIFFAACLSAMALDLVDETLLALASLFVILRIAHAHQILGPNKILRRANIFFASLFTLGTFWTWLFILAFF